MAFFLLNATAIAVRFLFFAGAEIKALEVANMTPSGIEADDLMHDEIAIEFSRRLDPESVTPDSIRLIPPLPGITRLDGEKTLRFRPEGRIRPATTYSLVLSPALRGRRGERPPQEPLEFSTTRFAFVSASPAAFDRDSYTVELAFNQPIRAGDLERAIEGEFSLAQRHNGGSNRVKVLGGSISMRHQVRISENRSSLVLLTLPAGLAGDGGPLGLESDVKLLFRITGQGAGHGETPLWAQGLEPVVLKPELAFLGMSAEWDDGVGAVRVRTTAPLDVEKARDYVKIEPEIPVTFSAGWDGMRIRGPFAPGRQYSVTLTAGFPAGEAGELAKDVSRRVWFDDMPPPLSFSYGGGFLSPDGLLTTAATSRNAEEFNLGVGKLYPSNLVETLLMDYGGVDGDHSKPEQVRRIAVTATPNEKAETLLDLREIITGECRAAGFDVVSGPLVEKLAESVRGGLEERLSGDGCRDDNGESAALACLVLARVGARPFSSSRNRRRKRRNASARPLRRRSTEAFAVAGARDAALSLYERHNPESAGTGMTGNARIDLSAWISAGLAAGLAPEKLTGLQAALVRELGGAFANWGARENFFVVDASGENWQRVGPPPSGVDSLTANGEGDLFPTRQGKAWNMLPTGTRV
ncbi:MAG: hypothetical protein LBJ46_02190 [Planctomycetota bacterium]|nr:hypothetical protein [Planctomycetota bacterium]